MSHSWKGSLKNPSIFHSKLLRSLFLDIFLSILTIELIGLSLLIKAYEHQKLDIITVTIIMLVLDLLMTGISLFIIHKLLIKPLYSINARLIQAYASPSSSDTLIFHPLSPNGIGDIENNLNQLFKRLSTHHKITHAHQKIAELRHEERVAEAAQLANYDSLTDLPNRNLLNDILHQLIEQARIEHKNVMVLFLILNDFHEINNAYGVETGTYLLKKIAQELTENMPAGTCIARTSTSQFAIAKGGMNGTHPITNLAQWVLDLFSKPIQINDHALLTSINIGISIFPIDGNDAETLISNAHTALNRTKNSIPNTFQFYEANMNQIIETRRKMLVDLHYALEGEQLVAYYQPQIDLNTHTLIGVEALLRWQHPEKGLIPPGLFISLAEESGLIIPMSEWMLLEACKQAALWKKQGLPPISMAVNLSGKQFKQKNIVEVINHVLKESELPPQHLEVEITESIIVDDLQQAVATMKALHGLGISISIDDFGTGYSSLSYLQQFPVQKLKIDQSFVRNIGKPGHDKPLADIIILLAKKLNLKVIAEGIETQEQAHYLRDHGCDEGQGYLYGKPLPADKIIELFKNLKSNPEP